MVESLGHIVLIGGPGPVDGRLVVSGVSARQHSPRTASHSEPADDRSGSKVMENGAWRLPPSTTSLSSPSAERHIKEIEQELRIKPRKSRLSRETGWYGCHSTFRQALKKRPSMPPRDIEDSSSGVDANLAAATSRPRVTRHQLNDYHPPSRPAASAMAASFPSQSGMGPDEENMPSSLSTRQLQPINASWSVDSVGGEIQQWQHSVLGRDASEFSASKHDGLAARLSTAVCELYRLLLSHAPLQVSRAVFRTLERQYGYLKLWCDGYGAPSGDLDAVLAESTRLRRATYRLLMSICHTLADSESGARIRMILQT